VSDAVKTALDDATLNAFLSRNPSDQEIERWVASPTSYVCPVCGKQGLQQWERLNRRCRQCLERYERAIAERDRREQPDRLTTVVEVPIKYQRCTLESWRGNYPEQLDEFIEKPAGTLACCGATGEGKTHATTAALLELDRKNVPCLWADVFSMADRLRREELESAQPYFRQLILRSVVLIDDFGHEKTTDFVANRLETIVRTRDQGNLGTLITSNLTEDELKARNPSLARRMFTLNPVLF
jgi:DNA replication protein DnaC